MGSCFRRCTYNVMRHSGSPSPTEHPVHLQRLLSTYNSGAMKTVAQGPLKFSVCLKHPANHSIPKKENVPVVRRDSYCCENAVGKERFIRKEYAMRATPPCVPSFTGYFRNVCKLPPCRRLIAPRPQQLTFRHTFTRLPVTPGTLFPILHP